MSLAVARPQHGDDMDDPEAALSVFLAALLLYLKYLTIGCIRLAGINPTVPACT